MSEIQKNEKSAIGENSEKENKLLSCLGLCARAGKIIFGVPMICEAMRRAGKNAPVWVFEAADTSENTHKKISDKCKFYNIKHTRLNKNGDDLAAALGKSGSLAAVALTDTQMSKMVEKYV